MVDVLRVLVVDDSSAMRAFVRASLETELGADVAEAKSGFEALRVLPREPWGLVVVDVNMPDINGLELVSFLRRSEVHRATPVILISTEASEVERRRGLELGADAFLAKPFDTESLAATARRVLGETK